MKRYLIFCIAAALLLSLCACGRGASAPAQVSEQLDTSADAAPSEAPAAEEPAQEEERPEAVLSPGAAEDSRLSALYQTAEDGTLYSCLAAGGGIASVYELLPDDPGYVASFILTDDGVYAAVRETSFFMDPTALYFFPADGGEGEIIAEEMSPSGRFCLTGGIVYYEGYTEDSISLQRYDPATGETTSAATDILALLTAADGFIYYSKLDGVYRNDSTLAAEAQLFPGGVNSMTVKGEVLCDLSFTQDGTQANLEFRERNGVIIQTRPLDTPTDHFIAGDDGALYVPQGKTILVLDAADGSELRTVELPEEYSYLLLRYAGSAGIVYETVVDGDIALLHLTEGSAEPELLTPLVVSEF